MGNGTSHHVLKDVEGMMSLIDNMSWSNCKFVCRFSSGWVEKQCKSVHNFPFLFLPTLFLTFSLSLSLSLSLNVPLSKNIKNLIICEQVIKY